METCGFLLRIFLAIFLGIFVSSCSCDAASPCRMRAVWVPTIKGVKCVCMDEFIGEKCQFRAGNSLSISASWSGANEVRVLWQTGGRTESYHLFVRKVMYDNVTELPKFGKWKPGALNQTGQHDVDVEGMRIQLNQSFTWEIRITINDGRNIKSASIFIDPPMVESSGVQNTGSTNSNEEGKCPFYRCPEQAFDFIKFFEDFKSPCFMKGIIIGIAAGVLATMIVSALIYVAIRLCIRPCSNKKWKRKSRSSSGLCNQEFSGQKSARASVAIDISDTDNSISVKSLFITLPEVIEVVPKSASVLW